MTKPTDLSTKPNVLKNIFKLVDFDYSPEDRFTAAWGYVLDREPALAQAVADIFLCETALNAKVKRVTDHPDCNSLKRPDFRIECDGLDILVEHKLEAGLHENQLENYLNLCGPNTYVAFVAPSYQPVPKGVLAHPHYLKPHGKDHFKWSDLYGAVKAQKGWLAEEFSDYMSCLGMMPFTLKGPEDIFDTRIKPVQFETALKAAADKIFVASNPGCFLKGTQTGLGVEVRTPHEAISLIYAWAAQRSSDIKEYEGPVLSVKVFEIDVSGQRALASGLITTPSGLAVSRFILGKPIRVGKGVCRYSYLAPLVDVIQDTKEATVQQMIEMLSVVRADFWLRR